MDFCLAKRFKRATQRQANDDGQQFQAFSSIGFGG